MTMDSLDTNAWKVLAKLLELAGNHFSNHGCNDYDLKNTPENMALLESLEAWNSPDPKERIPIQMDRNGSVLYASDASLMRYFAHLARELAGG